MMVTVPDVCEEGDYFFLQVTIEIPPPLSSNLPSEDFNEEATTAIRTACDELYPGFSLHTCSNSLLSCAAIAATF